MVVEGSAAHLSGCFPYHCKFGCLAAQSWRVVILE